MDNSVRLALKDVGYQYPTGYMALQDISLEIARGEFVGVLGANGSGKTTLLNVMDGLLKDYQGSVRLDGREVRKLTAREIYGTVGLVFQSPDAQLFASTVWEDVAFGPLNQGLTAEAARQRADRAIAAVTEEVGVSLDVTSVPDFPVKAGADTMLIVFRSHVEGARSEHPEAADDALRAYSGSTSNHSEVIRGRFTGQSN